MSSVERANATQIDNIQKKTGKSLDEITELINTSGLTKHGEIRSMLMEKLAPGYGDATMLVHYVLKTDVQLIVQEKGSPPMKSWMRYTVDQKPAYDPSMRS